MLLANACTAAIDPASDYQLRDLAPYENALEEGMQALLTRGGVVIDTVDADVGVQPLRGGGMLVLTVRGDDDTDFPEWRSAREYVVLRGSERIHPGERLPYFSNGFSSPRAIDRFLYYWRMQPTHVDGEYILSAARWDPAGGAVDDCILLRTFLQTDDRWHLRPPEDAGAGIRFRTIGFEAIVEPALGRDGEGFCREA